ncbi:hypothetical protein ACFOKF_02170 [Sphingobium rhizovicinum]|uniref:Uncharacterized protein n=1 Tax=Sphingobium rhizovicinum TaxID=432308 RepID=A0ABV7NCC4_9SPHN
MTQLTKTDIELATKAYGAARAAVQNCHAQVNAYADADENRPDDFDPEEYLQDMAAQLETRKNRVISAWLDRRRGFGAHERHRSDRFPRCLALISPVWLACRQSQPLHSRRSWKIRRLKL